MVATKKQKKSKRKTIQNHLHCCLKQWEPIVGVVVGWVGVGQGGCINLYPSVPLFLTIHPNIMVKHYWAMCKNNVKQKSKFRFEVCSMMCYTLHYNVSVIFFVIATCRIGCTTRMAKQILTLRAQASISIMNVFKIKTTGKINQINNFSHISHIKALRKIGIVRWIFIFFILNKMFKCKKKKKRQWQEGDGNMKVLY